MYEIIEQLCNERGISITNLCKQVTGSSGNLSTWKKGYMRSDYLKITAEILSVSTDYLLGVVGSSADTVINNGSNNTIQNGNGNTVNSSSPFEDNEVWDTYSKLSTKDKLEVKLDIINRGAK